ncbi:hypothetical protein Q3G72_004151 [Acer saccharum]|nr:hypothetical protein Q3G72_004151 [Acer saccharum]
MMEKYDDERAVEKIEKAAEKERADLKVGIGDIRADTSKIRDKETAEGQGHLGLGHPPPQIMHTIAPPSLVA